MTPAYALRGIRVERGGRAILELPALDIAPAAITAVVGGNGAGKSTLLRLLALLCAPAAGTLALHGTPVEFRPPALTALRRRVTYVASAPYLFHGSVRHNVAYGLRARRRSDAEAVAGALRAVGAEALAERGARSLSSGEAQRVALARALAPAPEVVCFDEPTANVDRASVPLIESVVASLPRAGCTVVLATHDLEQAERLAARVIALEDGHLRPAPVRSVLRGTAVHRGDRWLFETPGLAIELPAEAHPRAVAIDADDVVVSLAPLASSARNQVRGRLAAVQPETEGVLLLTVDCGQPLRARITAHSFAALGLTIGAEVWLTFKTTALHPIG